MSVAVLSGLSAAATLAIMLHASSGGFGIVPFAIWALLPYGLLAWLGIRTRQSGARAAIAIAGAVVICAAALFLYYQAFFVQLDAQSALVFVFVPAYQLVATAVTWGISRIPT